MSILKTIMGAPENLGPAPIPTPAPKPKRVRKPKAKPAEGVEAPEGINPYNRPFKGTTLDVYEVAEAFQVNCLPNSAPLAHALKKILTAGKRGKSVAQEIREARQCLQRWEEMNVSTFTVQTA